MESDPSGEVIRVGHATQMLLPSGENVLTGHVEQELVDSSRYNPGPHSSGASREKCAINQSLFKYLSWAETN